MGVTNNNTSARYEERYAQRLGSSKDCNKCGKRFHTGDMIYRKRAGKRKQYHQECWDKMQL